MRHLSFKLLLTILVGIISFTSYAQKDSEKVKKWNFKASPYLMFPHMNGDVAVRGIPLDVKVEPSDIFDNLDWGMMLALEAYSDNWVILVDGLYMDLDVKGETPVLSRKAKISVNQLGISFYGMYRVNDWLDAGLGGRVNSIESGIKIAPGDYVLPGSTFSQTQTWFDPLLVARAKTDFGGTDWRGGLLADLGGFGMASDLTWQINPYAGYQFSKLFELNLSYRWLYINYEKGRDTERFLYDVTTSGPELRLSFHF